MFAFLLFVVTCYATQLDVHAALKLNASPDEGLTTPTTWHKQTVDAAPIGTGLPTVASQELMPDRVFKWATPPATIPITAPAEAAEGSWHTVAVSAPIIGTGIVGGFWHPTGTAAAVAPPPTGGFWHPTGTAAAVAPPTGGLWLNSTTNSTRCWKPVPTGILWPHPPTAFMPCDFGQSTSVSEFSTATRTHPSTWQAGQTGISIGSYHGVKLQVVCGWVVSLTMYLAL
ncbi:hypothetical protein FPQ18DRAFT_156899 [Pyronema domesticum]|nr:hypothetical protein FPQ18DRAFT_156899 [Pyronema domesticum]